MSLAQMTPAQLETRRAHWQRRVEAADARHDRLRETNFWWAIDAWLRARLYEDVIERVEAEMQCRGMAVPG